MTIAANKPVLRSFKELFGGSGTGPEEIKKKPSAGKTYEKLAEQVKMSRNKVHRYIRLTFGAAVELSYLQQSTLLEKYLRLYMQQLSDQNYLFENRLKRRIDDASLRRIVL